MNNSALSLQKFSKGKLHRKNNDRKVFSNNLKRKKDIIMRAHYSRLLKREGYTEDDNIFIQKKKREISTKSKDSLDRKVVDSLGDINSSEKEDTVAQGIKKEGNFIERKHKNFKKKDPFAKAKSTFKNCKLEKEREIQAKQADHKATNKIRTSKIKKREEVSSG